MLCIKMLSLVQYIHANSYPHYAKRQGTESLHLRFFVVVILNEFLAYSRRWDHYLSSLVGIDFL